MQPHGQHGRELGSGPEQQHVGREERAEPQWEASGCWRGAACLLAGPGEMRQTPVLEPARIIRRRPAANAEGTPPPCSRPSPRLCGWF